MKDFYVYDCKCPICGNDLITIDHGRLSSVCDDEIIIDCLSNEHSFWRSPLDDPRYLLLRTRLFNRNLRYIRENNKTANEWIVYDIIPPEIVVRSHDYNKPIEISDIFTDVEFNELAELYKNHNK